MLLGFGGVAAVGPAGSIDLGGPKQRAVLALADARTGCCRPARPDGRSDVGGRPAGRGPRCRCVATSRTSARRSSRPGSVRTRIVFRDRGYVLEVAPEVIDLHLFDVLVDDARGLDGPAISSPPGPCSPVPSTSMPGRPLGAVGEELGLVEVAAHYEERRGEAVEALTDVRLALGEHAQLPAALASEIARQPYRERLRAQLALALYRAGRPVEALRSIAEARRLLRDDVGVDPVPSCAGSRRRSSPTTRRCWRGCRRGDRRPSSTRSAGPMAAVDEEKRFGRAVEEARVRAMLDRLASRGGVLVVSGEAGIGKSTLLRGLRAEALRRGFVVGWDRCPESAAGRPVPVVALGDGAAVARRVVRRPTPSRSEQEAAGTLLATHLGVLDRLRARRRPGGDRDRRPAVGRRRHAVAAGVPRPRAGAAAHPPRRRRAPGRVRRAGRRRARLPGRAGPHHRSGAPRR